jgi:NAD-dependent deacetylase
MVEVEVARARLESARRPAALTGAGLSADSGLATFRGAEGLWRRWRPEELATASAFRRDPILVWEWYEARRAHAAGAEPNAGHRALARLESARPEFALITQNVDGLHARAGSSRALELHGSLWRSRCADCGRRRARPLEPRVPLPPLCAECGGLERPDVVWFGESLETAVAAEAFRAAEACDVLLVVGASGAVEPAASIARAAKRGGALLIEVNAEATALTALADVVLRGRAAEILDRLAP